MRAAWYSEFHEIEQVQDSRKLWAFEIPFSYLMALQLCREVAIKKTICAWHQNKTLEICHKSQHFFLFQAMDYYPTSKRRSTLVRTIQAKHYYILCWATHTISKSVVIQSGPERSRQRQRLSTCCCSSSPLLSKLNNSALIGSKLLLLTHTVTVHFIF